MMNEVLEERGDPEFSLVMPCFNEEAIVSHTIRKLLAAFSKAGYRLEIIAVDNGSSDRTGEILRAFAARDASLVHHTVKVNEGYGNGVLAGLPLANAPWVGIIPADGQVDAEDVLRLYEVARESNSRVIVKVRRRFRLDGVIRKIVSVAYNTTFRVMWPRIASIDINGSPKIMPREILPALALESKGWFLDPEIMIKAHALGIQVMELNVFARLRGGGVSHVRAGTCWDFVTNLLKYRFTTNWKKGLRRDRCGMLETAPLRVRKW